MARVKGWQDGTQNWDFEDTWDVHNDIFFEYKGHEYRICLEGDNNLYDVEDGYKVLRHFESKEDFYSSTIFGRPIKEVIDDSYLTWLC